MENMVVSEMKHLLEEERTRVVEHDGDKSEQPIHSIKDVNHSGQLSRTGSCSRIQKEVSSTDSRSNELATHIFLNSVFPFTVENV
jgi:hypothetical protein